MYFFDLMSSAMIKSQDYHLVTYLPYSILSFKLNCSSVHRPHLQFPRDYQVSWLPKCGQTKGHLSDSI
jgi:hypothetical protein